MDEVTSPELEKLAESMTGVELNTYEVYSTHLGFIKYAIAATPKEALELALQWPELKGQPDITVYLDGHLVASDYF